MTIFDLVDRHAEVLRGIAGKYEAGSAEEEAIRIAATALLFVAIEHRAGFEQFLAVQRWGEPRLTLDIDCTLLTGFGHETGFIDALLAAFAGRVDHPREFALAYRVLCSTAIPRCRLT